MAKGKTISITLPHIVVEYYENKGKKIEMARGAIIRNVILKDYSAETKSEIQSEILDESSGIAAS